MEKYFQGKCVLISGASSGIGFSLAIKLVDLGSTVILVARNIEKLDKARQELIARGGNELAVMTCAVDIGQRAAVEAKLASIVQKTPPDILINNAGVPSCKLFDDITAGEFQDVMKVNFFGHIWVTQAVLPMMRRKGAGDIVNLSSMAGIIGIAGYTAYSASKFALVGFSQCLRNELAGTGIRVLSVLPSDVATPLLDAENETKPNANLAISGNAKSMTCDYVADRVLKAITKRKSEVVISPLSGHVFAYLDRVFPSLTKWALDAIAKKHNKMHQ